MTTNKTVKLNEAQQAIVDKIATTHYLVRHKGYGPHGNPQHSWTLNERTKGGRYERINAGTAKAIVDKVGLQKVEEHSDYWHCYYQLAK